MVMMMMVGLEQLGRMHELEVDHSLTLLLAHTRICSLPHRLGQLDSLIALGGLILVAMADGNREPVRTPEPAPDPSSPPRRRGKKWKTVDYDDAQYWEKRYAAVRPSQETFEWLQGLDRWW